MPSQYSTKGNSWCHRIDKIVVEGKQALTWYRNKGQTILECNSKEHYWKIPSSASNSFVTAPIEPQQAHLTNHTATAEHRHFERQRINSNSRQSCIGNVDTNRNQFIEIETDPNWKTVNGLTDRHLYHHKIQQSSITVHCDRIDYRRGENIDQSDSTHLRMVRQRFRTAVHTFSRDTAIHKSNHRIKNQRPDRIHRIFQKKEHQHFIDRTYATTNLEIMARLYSPVNWSLTALHDSETGGTVTDVSQSRNILLSKSFMNDPFDSLIVATCKFRTKIIQRCQWHRRKSRVTLEIVRNRRVNQFV